MTYLSREWVTVESSNIWKIKYDEKNKNLQVIFDSKDSKTGVRRGKPTRYTYDNVPVKIAEDFFAAGSHGKYFIANIRDKFVTHGPFAA